MGVPGGLVVKISPSNARNVGSIPGQGAEIPHAAPPKRSKHKNNPKGKVLIKNAGYIVSPHQN